MKLLALLGSFLLCTSLLLAQDPPKPDTPRPEHQGGQPSLFPSGYLDHESLTARLKSAAEKQPEVARLTSLTKTAGGRDVWLMTLVRVPDAKARPHPAILVVANLEADHLVGSQVALGLIEALLAAPHDSDLGKALDRHTIYVVPRLNPDGAERLLTAHVDLRTNLRRMDRDRDGRQNEDGPEDVNGDGLVTRMRVKDAKATLVADAKDARLLRKADPAKGERAVYSEYAEGLDNDNDGQVNEDPPGGVNLNRNWPHRWTEFDLEAGYSPASEPEVRALIQFAFDHPEIAVVWTLGLNDNLRNEPKKPPATIDDADLPFFAELSRLYRKQTGAETKAEEPRKEAPASKSEPPAPKGELAAGKRGRVARGGPGTSPPPSRPGGAASASSWLEPTTDGSMSEWAYHQYGIVGLASRLWTVPELPADAGEGEARWLAWNDQVMGGRAFVPFKEFDHPTLGRVEIGGWKPGVRINPPIEEVKALVDSHLAFLKQLVAKLPALAIGEVKVEAKGGGLFQVTVTVTNTGYLPTALAQGVRTRKADPVLVRLQTGDAKLLAGRALNRLDTLAGSGGHQEFRWLVQAPESVKSITIEATTPKAGRVAKQIDLK